MTDNIIRLSDYNRKIGEPCVGEAEIIAMPVKKPDVPPIMGPHDYAMLAIEWSCLDE